MADTLEIVDTNVNVDTQDGNHDKFAHYVRKEAVLTSAVFGTPAKALCGKEWVPLEDGTKYPVCGTCKEIYEDNLRLLDNDA